MVLHWRYRFLDSTLTSYGWFSFLETSATYSTTSSKRYHRVERVHSQCWRICGETIETIPFTFDDERRTKCQRKLHRWGLLAEPQTGGLYFLTSPHKHVIDRQYLINPPAPTSLAYVLFYLPRAALASFTRSSMRSLIRGRRFFIDVIYIMSVTGFFIRRVIVSAVRVRKYWFVFAWK